MMTGHSTGHGGRPARSVRRVAAAICAAAVSSLFADGATSDPVSVFTAPERSFIWCTATNSTLTLPIAFPDGATSATLSVTGLRYSATYEGLSEGDFDLSLPAATSPSAENAYNLALTFSDGTAQTARIGVIEGVSPAASGTTRCLAPASSRRWQRVDACATIPVPYGATAFSFTLNGGEPVTDSGLDGAAGWYAFAMPSYSSATLACTDAGGMQYAANLVGHASTMFIVR